MMGADLWHHDISKVAEVLPDGLRQAHAAGLTRVLNSIDFKKQPRWKGSATKNKAVAYHIWLYHFLGGDDMKLVPPPLATTADDPLKVQSETWRTQAFRLEIEFKAEVKRLESAIKRGIAGAESDLDALRSARVPHAVLRLRNERPAGIRRAAAAPPAPSPPKPRGRPTPGVWQLAGQVEEHPSRSDPDYQPPRWLTAQMAGRKRLRCLSPPAPQRLPLHGPDGLPLYEGMRAAYERASGPEQRECVPWAAMVQRMGWPATWADRSPMRAGGSA